MSVSDFIGRSFIPAPKSTIDTLDTGKSPADWVEILADKGIVISERNLRERANRIGARIKLGRNMLITLGHMELILKDNQCHSSRTSVKANGGPKAVSNITDSPSRASNDPALERALKLAHGNGATKKRSGSVGSTSTGQKRRTSR